MFNKKKKRWRHGKPGGSKEQNPDNVNRPQDNRGPSPVASQYKPVEEDLSGIEIPPELSLNVILPKKSPEEEQAALANPPVCMLCNMPIRSLFTAVRHNETNELVHFDCVLRDLNKENMPKLGRFKKIYYIGAGNFAIVKEFYDKRGHFKSYEIVEKISYEKKEK